ncbi:MAG TPA: radical SAM protein [Dehalococcoidia bacterium]|jgi:wyosine [tRNA(Phe)-imidazoG37] synthetase (radical SAM superfamily)|nr:radical SAM protein [Dehalococcoidia bacterium]
MPAIALQSGIIYGPVRSRRLGWSLGLNISPTTYKLCSFNCVYCQYGWTKVWTMDASTQLGDLPTPEEFEQALLEALRKNRDHEINNITFSGNGEPTLHPQFEELVSIARRLKERYLPSAGLGVLSNSSTVSLERVRRALGKLDFKIMKLDAGDPETFAKINRACPGVDYQIVIKGLKSLAGVTLQTMFIDGSPSNSGEREVLKWQERVGEIKPIKAQIYSLHRPSAASSLREVPAERLEEIAARTEAITGIRVEAIVAPAPYHRKINQPYDR